MKKLGWCIGNTTDGDVGIEVEVEFTKMPGVFKSDTWLSKSDGSLRHIGVEYVSSPILMSDLDKAVDEVVGHINKYPHVKDSPRTSVHVHVNCTKLTPIQVWTGLVYTWIMEESLMQLCAAHRKGNRFCLGIDSIPSVVKLSRKAIESKIFDFRLFTRNNHKYSFTAPHNLATLGTVEFRGLQGIYDTEYITNWVKSVYLCIHGSSNMFKDPVEMIRYWELNGNEAFAAIAGIPAIDVERRIGNVYDLVYNVDWEAYVKAGETKRKFKSPEPMYRLEMDNPIARAVNAADFRIPFPEPDRG